MNLVAVTTEPMREEMRAPQGAQTSATTISAEHYAIPSAAIVTGDVSRVMGSMTHGDHINVPTE